MTSEAFTLFDTTIGRCAIAWGPDGIVALKLPERNDGAMRRRMRKLHPEAEEGTVPLEVKAVIDSIQRLLMGEARDLSSVALDMSRVAAVAVATRRATREPHNTRQSA